MEMPNMSYLLTLPNQTEKTYGNLPTAINKAIQNLKNQMNPTMQAMLEKLDTTKPNYHAYDDSGEFFINVQPIDIVNTAKPKQVLAVIAFTPSRQKELRAIITKA